MDKTLLNIPTNYVFSSFCCLKKKNMKITKCSQIISLMSKMPIFYNNKLNININIRSMYNILCNK